MLGIFSKIGGLFTALSLLVKIAVSGFNQTRYEVQVAKLVKFEFPTMFADYTMQDLKGKIKAILTPQKMFYMFFKINEVDEKVHN